ncbi:MAG: hypothetical protein LBD11_05565 [Candidatus Peribacteria bacterium]|jgi:hypothetical protein|nr:hypothetical protein [Candidatus Peribacteria bacterium]
MEIKQKFERVKQKMKNPESRKRIQQLMRKKENRPWLIGVGAGFVVPGPLGLGVAAVFAMVKWNELFPDDPIDSKESNLND